jgi:hypothetical protein
VKSRLLSYHGYEVSVATLALQRKPAICSHCQVLTFYLWRNILFDSGGTIEPQARNFEASKEALLHDLASLAEHCRISTGRAECVNVNKSHDILFLEMDADCPTILCDGCAFASISKFCPRLGKTRKPKSASSSLSRSPTPCRFNTSHLTSRVSQGERGRATGE